MNGLYYIADTLGMSLKSHGEGMVGESEQVVDLGPWQAKLNLMVESDVLQSERAAVLVCFTKNLWGYLTSVDNDTSLYLIDAKLAGLGGTKNPVFLGINIGTSLDGFRHLKAIKATYKFKDAKWVRTDVDNLEQVPGN